MDMNLFLQACEGNMYNQLPGNFLGVVHKIRNTIGESRNQSRH